MRAEHADRITDDYWEGADLVMEVVSGGDDDRRRDLKTKREEYALAAIPEYWIVDPELGQITVLTLDGPTYAVHGEFKRGEQATSKLLPGFVVDVTSALAASGRIDGGSTAMSIVPEKPCLGFGEPTWDMAQLFPTQGTWSEAELPDPRHQPAWWSFQTDSSSSCPCRQLTHQLIAHLLHRPPGVVCRGQRPWHCRRSTVQGATLGREVSRTRRVVHASGTCIPDDPRILGGRRPGDGSGQRWRRGPPPRPEVTKRDEYAQAGIPEYWIVDPELGQITVLTLDGSTYAVHGEFSRGQQATSKLLPGFAVDVTSALAAKQ